MSPLLHLAHAAPQRERALARVQSAANGIVRHGAAIEPARPANLTPPPGLGRDALIGTAPPLGQRLPLLVGEPVAVLIRLDPVRRSEHLVHGRFVVVERIPGGGRTA